MKPLPPALVLAAALTVLATPPRAEGGDSTALSVSARSADDIQRWRAKLRTDFPLSRRLAIERLGELGKTAGAAVPDLARILGQDSDLTNRARAAWALGAIGTPADEVVSALLSALKDDSPLVPLSAAKALAQVGRPATAELTRALGSDHANTRLTAAEILAHADEPSRAELADVLDPFLNHPRADFRARALAAAAALGQGGADLLPRVFSSLEDESWQVRAAGARALAAISHDADGVRAIARSLRSDESKEVRCTAAELLGSVGPDHPAALAALVDAFDDGDKRTRALSSLSAAAFGAEAVPAILAAAGKPSLQNRIRCAALDALHEMGPSASSAVPELLVYLRDEDWLVRHSAATALGAIGSPTRECVEALKTAQKMDPHQGVRQASGHALARFQQGLQATDPPQAPVGSSTHKRGEP
jgi:HEAT repeat protein